MAIVFKIVFKIALNLSGPARSRLHAHIIGYACYRPKSLCKKSLINLNLDDRYN